MAEEYTLDQTGTTWKVKLINCVSGSVVTTTNIDTVSIVFTRSNGSTFSKDADLVEDTQNEGTFFIEYRNLGSEESIFNGDDDLGLWTYAGGGVLIDDSTFRTSEKTIFWVVP